MNRREFFSWFCGLASLPVVGRLFERCPTGSKVQAEYLNRLWVGGEMEPGPRTIRSSASFNEDAKPMRVTIGGYDENGVYREETLTLLGDTPVASKYAYRTAGLRDCEPRLPLAENSG